MSAAWTILAESSDAKQPDSWKMRRIGDLVTLTNGFPFSSESFTPDGGMPLVRIRDLEARSFETYVSGDVPTNAIIRDGDVIVGMDGDFNVKVWDRGEAALNQRLCVLRPQPGIDIRFIAYGLPASLKVINDLTFSTTVKHLSSQDILRERILLPPLEEQRRIADFLDAETSRMDELVARRNHQLDLLVDREISTIADMLSGGSNRYTGRATGWDWLPFIPPDWTIGPVYAYFDTQLGKMLNPDRTNGSNLGKYLRNANVHWYSIDIDDMAEMHFDPDEICRYSIGSGDLLVCEGGAGVAEAAIWSGQLEKCYFQKSLHRVRQRRELPVDWLMYWLRLAKHCGVFEAGGNVATIPHLTGEQLRQYRIPIPPDGSTLSQRAKKTIRTILQLRSRLVSAQTLLTERRQALITAAVTGQFDVSTASGRGV